MKTERLPDLWLAPDKFDIHQFNAASGSRLPKLDTPGNGWMATIQSDDGATLVCSSHLNVASDRVETGWRRFDVSGPLDFSLTGIIAAYTRILADAGIPVFVLSSFETDHILIRADRLNAALEAFSLCGINVHSR